MTHSSCLVILPAEADAEAEVATAMQPFQEDSEWFGDGTRWDWYSMGGRFTGLLDGYDPTVNPDNWESCDICAGTGTRRDAPSPDFEIKEGYCNGCTGHKRCPVGMRVKWPTQWKRHDGDIMDAAQFRKIQNKTPVAACVALKDGVWHEYERVGWWGGTVKSEREMQGQDTCETHTYPRRDKRESIIKTYNEAWEQWEARFQGRFLDQLSSDDIVVVVGYHV